MQRHLAAVGVSWFILNLFTACASADDWRPLFNGKDLAGWQPVGEGDNWGVTNGELQCTGKPGAHWIRTEEEYANFELRLEFKLGKNGNSGVFVRAPESGSPWVEGLEIQLLDDFGPKWKNLKPDQFTAAIYAVEAPSQRATKPAGQWQSMRIHCLRRQLKVWVNKEQVIDADLDSLLKKSEKVPGLKRKTGYIGLQDHGDSMAFRKIEIRELR